MKKQLLTAAMAGLLSVSAVMSAFASNEVSGGGVRPASDGTDVYAGIILNDPDAKISVIVPTLFAFVVNGSVTANADPISTTNGSLTLPNVMVDVDTENPNGDGSFNYAVETVGTSGGNMVFENRSTKANPDNTSLETRLPIDVTIKGSIKNDLTAAERNYWQHVGGDGTAISGDVTKFKQYTLGIGEVGGTMNWFSQANAQGGYEMADTITLDAPDLEWDGSNYNNLDDGGVYAFLGSQTNLDFRVAVGGQRGQYNQVEESARVGSIVWTVGYQIANNGTIDTSPDEDPLTP